MQPAQALSRPVPGHVFDGKYLIVEQLGEGGTGVVFAAHNGPTSSGFPVAIKWLKPEAVKDRQSVKHFLREADVAGYIKSEFVVKVFDKQADPTYIVMERLVGQSLRDFMDELGRPLTLDEAVSIMGPVMRAVRAAHRTELPSGVGVIHRDLKPENIFLDRSGEAGTCTPKVLDFGIAKLLEPNVDVTMETSELVRGTPSYMAREQLFERDAVGPWTDVHALGVILYELLSGQRPFGGKVAFDICLNVREGIYTPLRELCPDLPEGLDEVIERAFHLDRTYRYRSVADLEVALHPYWGAVPGSSVDLPSDPPLDSGPKPSSAAIELPSEAPLAVTAADTVEPRGGSAELEVREAEPKRTGLWLAAGAVVLGLGVAVAFGAGRFGQETAGTAETSPGQGTPALPDEDRQPTTDDPLPAHPTDDTAGAGVDLPTDLEPSEPPVSPNTAGPVALESLSARPEPPGRLRYEVRKRYPKQARREGVDGFAEVRVELGGNGTVRAVELVQQSDDTYRWFESCRAAVRAAGAWRPAPRSHGGDPVLVSLPYTCRYQLPKAPRRPSAREAEEARRTDAVRARRALRKAHAYFDQGLLELSRRQFCTVLQLDPGNAEAELKLKLMNASCD